jgi:hypothetical protein
MSKIRARVCSVSEVYAPAELVAACSFFRGKICFGEQFCESVDLSHILGVKEFGARNLNALLFSICFPNVLFYDTEVALNLMAPENVLVVARICDYLGTTSFLELRRAWFSSWQMTYPETALTMIDSKAPAVIEALYSAKIDVGTPPDVELLGIESIIRHSDVQDAFLDDAACCLVNRSFSPSSSLSPFSFSSVSSDQLAAIGVTSCVESRFCRVCVPRPIPFRHIGLKEVVIPYLAGLLPKNFLSFLRTIVIPGAQVVIAGGSVSEAFSRNPSPDPSSDVNVWIVGEKAAKRARMTLWCRLLQALVSPMTGEEPLFSVKGSAVTAHASWLIRPVQILRTNFRTMLELVSHFDMTHVQCAWDGKNDVVMTAGCALAHITKKTRISSWMTTKPMLSRVEKASRGGFDATHILDDTDNAGYCDSRRYVTPKELAACVDVKRRRSMIERMTGGLVAEDVKAAIEMSFAEDLVDHPPGDISNSNAVFFKAKYETFDVFACRRNSRPFLVCDSLESWMLACSMVQCGKFVSTSTEHDGGLVFLRKDAPVVRTPFAIFELRTLGIGNGVAVTLFEKSGYENNSQLSRLRALIGSAKDFPCSVRFDEERAATKSPLRFETLLCEGAIIEDSMTGKIVPFEMIENISKEPKCARVSVDAAALLSIEDMNGTILHVVNYVLSMRIGLDTIEEA